MKKRTTKEELIKSISRDNKLEKKYVRLAYESLEKKIIELLHEVDKDHEAEIKVFDGITIEGKYIPKATRINNLTGNEIDITERIRPSVKVSRRYFERLNNLL